MTRLLSHWAAICFLRDSETPITMCALLGAPTSLLGPPLDYMRIRPHSPRRMRDLPRIDSPPKKIVELVVC